MITEQLDVFSVLQAFLDGVHEKASEGLNVVLRRNHGHYTYADKKFLVYVTLFPKEVELVFEGEQLGNGVCSVTLDACRSSGEILVGGLLFLNGTCEEIRAALASREALVLAELLSLLSD